MPKNAQDRERDHMARIAAHSLLNANDNLPPISEILGQASTSTVDSNISVRQPVNAVAGDNCLTEGAESQGRISPVRRFFCLFVTFDFAFTVLLWLICIVTTQGDYIVNLEKQVKYFNVKTSFFDIVMTSCSRAVFLLLAYALIRIQHWWMVALTTTASSAFLITKVFLYDWVNDRESKNSGSTFNVILLLCSFVLAWGEAWFLDFRVLPQEHRARELLAHDIERQPLVCDNPSAVLFADDQGGNDTAPFYSPIQSESDASDDDSVSGPKVHKNQLSSQEKIFKHEGSKTLEMCWQILQIPNWKEETKSIGGDVVFSKSVPTIGKMFKLIALIDISPRILLNELFWKVETIPKWNPTVLQSKIVQTIDNHTDITYQVSADGANGIVKSRDFVTLRYWGRKNGTLVIASVAASHSQMPETKTYIRGKNGPGAFVLQPLDGQFNKCKLHWLLNTDLKGWIPQSIIDQTMSSVMLDYVRHLRKHVTGTQNTS